MSKRFYITTAIDYVNGEPHLGHAYEKVITDVIARARASLGEAPFYLTGLDEHGQKVQQAAQSKGMDPQAYCDELALTWRAFAEKLQLSNQDFIRTSESRHKAFVQAILSKLHAADQFYKAEYHGFYSTKEETFLTDRDRREDGTFDPMYGEVVELAEENYYFKLSNHQTWLIDHIQNHPEFVYPENRRNEVLGFLNSGPLEDLCISRPISRLNWGIPLPFDAGYVTYVWFDALVNYATVPADHGDPLVTPFLGSPCSESGPELWPADAHVIGKDILKFHAVYWPIMLRTIGLPLPRQILVHGWWQKDHQKISKSIGNIVDPMVVIDEWGLDAFRYYVVRELELGPDGNWTDSGFAARYQSELANGLGNLVNRSLSMLHRYRQGRVPASSTDLQEEAERICGEVIESYRAHRLQGALQIILQLVDRANQYVDQTAPFKIAKDPDQQGRLDEILYCLVETCRFLANLLWPVIPGAAQKIYRQLALEETPDQLSDLRWGGLVSGHIVGKAEPLFPRKDLVLKTD